MLIRKTDIVMKIKETILRSIRLAIIPIFIGLSLTAFADNPPPPPGGSGGAGGGTGGTGQQRNGAPIGSGMLLLIGLGAAYGGKKVYDSRKNFDK